MALAHSFGRMIDLQVLEHYLRNGIIRPWLSVPKVEPISTIFVTSFKCLARHTVLVFFVPSAILKII